MLIMIENVLLKILGIYIITTSITVSRKERNDAENIEVLL